MTGRVAAVLPSWKVRRPLLAVACVAGAGIVLKRSRSTAVTKAPRRRLRVSREVPKPLSTMMNLRRLGGSIAEIVTLGRPHLRARDATLKDVVLSSPKTAYQLEPEQRRELDAIMARRHRLASR